MSARSILNPPLNTTLSPSGNLILNSLVANTINVNTLEPVYGTSLITIPASLTVDGTIYVSSNNANLSVYGANGNEIGLLSSPYVEGTATVISLQTENTTGDIIDSITCSSYNNALAVPLITTFSYSGLQSIDIGYSFSTGTIAITPLPDTIINIQTITWPSTGVWLLNISGYYTGGVASQENQISFSGSPTVMYGLNQQAVLGNMSFIVTQFFVCTNVASLIYINTLTGSTTSSPMQFDVSYVRIA